MRFRVIPPAGVPAGSPFAAIRPAFAVLCLLLAGALLAADLGFTTHVGPGLINRLEQRFGTPARDRVGNWVGFGREQRSPSMSQRLAGARGREADALQVVNGWFNRIRFIEDQAHWNQVDYWATPAETVASNGGDCEDFAIAKYFFLKELGVPIDKLRITYVRALKLNQAHMVLAYYPTPDSEPLILDNLENRIRPASERTDLEPVYSFNDDEVRMVQGGRRTQPSQIRAWKSLLDRLTAETAP